MGGCCLSGGNILIDKYALFSTAIACIYRDIQKIERVEMRKFGLKGPHAQCLISMRQHPEGITAAQLCEFCEKDKAAISRTIAEMEQAGLICRIEKNGNRYRALLYLTEAGNRAAEAVSRKAHMAVEQAGIGLDDAQREVFYRVLGQIAGNLHAICRDGILDEQE